MFLKNYFPLTMEVADSSEALVRIRQTTQQLISECRNRDSHCCENDTFLISALC
jgi:hypothetical protein